MISPRIEVDLGAIEHNARVLVKRLARRGIAVTGVTKATLGSPDVAKAMIRGGVTRIGDSRIENLEALRDAGIRVPLTLLRSPAPQWADRAVATAASSLVSDADVVDALSAAAGRRALTHGIVLMVELGDLREGVMVADIGDLARRISRTRHVSLAGIGTNLACRSGVIPGDDQMKQLSALATAISGRFGVGAPVVSGGNSANLGWALGRGSVGNVNDLRLGEAILLGMDPLTRTPIEGLRRDAFCVVAPVIESLDKPTEAWGLRGQGAFGKVAATRSRGTIVQTLVALGRQDVDPDGVTPPVGFHVLGASSDHLVLETPRRVAAGTEVRFGVDYSALLRAMTSPFVAERLVQAPVGHGSAA
ncbi:alanine/ornithine racemase family PLP-dependent enzyme [Demequina litorisediminis]|uniref:Amino-acid racemase n=1 Tax=Demequina litorisediminis TaxID=1849022 RepID=A0ABQ6IJP3_9MICO|nr:alanine/ornithine racemase family PLP-dependent enzyme [Demequina litorisediminis]GMA36937.1 amino-acid racemase [Demequina litorisediminis]